MKDQQELRDALDSIERNFTGQDKAGVPRAAAAGDVITVMKWARRVANLDCEAAAVALCRLDNATGPEWAAKDVPCDIHREAARQAINAALDTKGDRQ